MPCACGAKKKSGQEVWTVRLPNGTTKSYSSEIEAKAEAQRTGGTAKRS